MITKGFKNIDEYINLHSGKTQSLLRKMRQTINTTAPGTVETIKYRMPTLVLNGTNLVHFAAIKEHLGFYPTPAPIVAYKKELSKYVTTKGAIQFPFDKPIPFRLIQKIVKFRVKQVLAKQKSA